MSSCARQRARSASMLLPAVVALRTTRLCGSWPPSAFSRRSLSCHLAMLAASGNRACSSSSVFLNTSSMFQKEILVVSPRLRSLSLRSSTTRVAPPASARTAMVLLRRLSLSARSVRVLAVGRCRTASELDLRGRAHCSPLPYLISSLSVS
jgi:hypothetical protein